MYIYACNETEIFERHFTVVSLHPLTYSRLAEIALARFDNYGDYGPDDVDMNYDVLDVPAWVLSRAQIQTFKSTGYLILS